jgi:hypothetical protein
LQEGGVAGLGFGIVGGKVHEHADASHALALLRARRKRPRYGPSGDHFDDEIASSHCAPRIKNRECRLATQPIKSGNCDRRNRGIGPVCAAAIQRRACLLWVIFV